jgi:hypothetical protein
MQAQPRNLGAEDGSRRANVQSVEIRLAGRAVLRCTRTLLRKEREEIPTTATGSDRRREHPIDAENSMASAVNGEVGRAKKEDVNVSA